MPFRVLLPRTKSSNSIAPPIRSNMRKGYLSCRNVLLVGWALAAVASASELATKALFDAVRADDVEGIQESVADGAEINQRGSGGQTPLVHAVLTGKEAAVGALLALGADTSIPEKDGYTILHAAGFQGRAGILPELAAHQHPETFDPWHAHEDGYYPIHRACWGREERHADTVRAFLELGVPHDLTASNGKTCLEMTRNPKTREYLVAAAGGAKEAPEEL